MKLRKQIVVGTTSYYLTSNKLIAYKDESFGYAVTIIREFVNEEFYHTPEHVRSCIVYMINHVIGQDEFTPEHKAVAALEFALKVRSLRMSEENISSIELLDDFLKIISEYFHVSFRDGEDYFLKFDLSKTYTCDPKLTSDFYHKREVLFNSKRNDKKKNKVCTIKDKLYVSADNKNLEPHKGGIS